MENINERLKYLRKSILKINQSDMADILGIKRSSYTLVENGKRSLKDTHIKLIVTHFSVNESWLKYGIGEIFAENKLKPVFMQNFESLDYPLQKYILEIMEKHISEQNMS